MAGYDCVGMAKRVLERHGLDYVVEIGKHVKIKIAFGAVKQTLVCGASTSDKCAIRNFYSTIRKVLIGMGVEFVDSKDLLFN